MPSTYFNIGLIQRSKGHSVTAAAAYNSRSQIYDFRAGKCHDYARYPGECVHSEIMLAGNAPEIFSDRDRLWNHVENMERRKDAQLARSGIMGLPHELTDDQRLALLRDFLQVTYVDHGMLVDFSIHAPTDGDPRNHHAHVLIAMRQHNEQGFFSTKTTKWNSKHLTAQWREAWASAQNKHFEMAGLGLRVHPSKLLPIDLKPKFSDPQIAAIFKPEFESEIPVGRSDWNHHKKGTPRRHAELPDRFLINQAIIDRNADKSHDRALALRSLEARRAAEKPALQPAPTPAEFIGPMPPNRETKDLPPTVFEPPPLPQSDSPTAYDHHLDDVMAQYGHHMSFVEQIQLALAYADISHELRAGRVTDVAKQFLMDKTREVVQMAHERSLARQRRH